MESTTLLPRSGVYRNLAQARHTLQYVCIEYLTTRAAVAAHRRAVKADPTILDNGVMYCKNLTPQEAEAERRDLDRRVILGLVGCGVLYAALVAVWWVAFGNLIF